MKSVACITGGAGALGRAFAVECASRGWDLFLTDLHPEGLENLAKSLQNTYGVEVGYHACDLADFDSRTLLFREIENRGLCFHLLVNIAGLDYEGPFADRTREQITGLLRLNIEASLEMTHAILKRRDPSKSFRVVNVCSLAAFYMMPSKAMYSSSKRFLYHFSMALGEELRPLGATVTALCPAGMPTTEECIRAIHAQGFAGRVTSKNTGFVASRAIRHALRGDPVYIPGMLNKTLRLLGALLPEKLVARLIGLRWGAAARKTGTVQAGAGAAKLPA